MLRATGQACCCGVPRETLLRQLPYLGGYVSTLWAVSKVAMSMGIFRTRLCNAASPAAAALGLPQTLHPHQESRTPYLWGGQSWLCGAQVANAARSPATSYIAAPAASWLDDFLAWISPEIPRCCRAFPGSEGVPLAGGARSGAQHTEPENLGKHLGIPKTPSTSENP